MINDCEKLLESVGTDTDNKICLAKKTDKDDESLENGRWVEFMGGVHLLKESTGDHTPRFVYEVFSNN